MPASIDAQKRRLGEIFGFLQIADEMMQDADRAILILGYQMIERARFVVAYLKHEANVGITTPAFFVRTDGLGHQKGTSALGSESFWVGIPPLGGSESG